MAEKGKRAPWGAGTAFYSKAHGCYVARKTVQGRRVERWGRTRAEAIRKRDAAVPPDRDTTTVAAWCERWLESLDVRPLTRDSYAHSVEKWIVPVLGALKASALAAHHVEAAARKWAEKLSANTILLVLKHLRICLAAALRAGLVSHNPVAVAKKPKSTKPKIQPYSPEQLAKIIGTVRPAERIVALLAATGLRRGEALALLVTDFDPKAGTVSITKGDIGRHGVGPPKSEPSVRTISVPAQALPAVRAAIGKRTSGPMFIGARGGKVTDSGVWTKFAAVLDRAGLPRRGVHQLRHSVATMLISAGEPLGDVSKFLGDRVETLVRHYLHATGGDPAVAIGRLLGNKGGERVGKEGAKRRRKPGK